MLIKMGLEQEQWPAIGEEDLIEPYEETCSEDALPVEEALRLQNLYVTAFFNYHLLSIESYSTMLTEDYASSNEPGVLFTAKSN